MSVEVEVEEGWVEGWVAVLVRVAVEEVRTPIHGPGVVCSTHVMCPRRTDVLVYEAASRWRRRTWL